MKQLAKAYDIKSSPFIFVHWHGVSDLSNGELAKTFGSEYYINDEKLFKTGDNGLYVQGLHKHKDIEENIRKVTSYPFKSQYRYKHSFKGSDHSNGEFFTNEELGGLVALYQDVQGRQWRRLRRHSGG